MLLRFQWQIEKLWLESGLGPGLFRGHVPISMLFPVFSSKYCRLLDSILALNWYILIFFQCRSKISDLEHTLTQVIKENQVEKETTSKKYERDMEKNKFVFHYFVGKKIQDIKGWVDLFRVPKNRYFFPFECRWSV